MSKWNTWKNHVENFFYYYKWHTVFALLAIFMIVTTVVQVRSRIDYDTTITFLGSFGQDEEKMKEFQDCMEQCLSDANGDGEVHVLPYFLMISGDTLSAEQDNAAAVRLQGMLLTRETSVLILDYESMNDLAEGGALENLDSFYREYGLEESDCTYGIPISGNNEVFSMFSMTGTQYYIARLAKAEDMTDRQIIDYENAEQVIRMVIEGQE